MQTITKEKERSQDVNQKAKVLNEAFSKGAEKKLAAKMETFEENKRAQELAKLERLKEHVGPSLQMHSIIYSPVIS